VSTLAYATLTKLREAAPPGTSDSKAAADSDNPDAGRPGVTVWADAAAALVPAEVLAAQAFLVGVVTEQQDRPLLSADPVTVFTDPHAAKWMFWGLLVVSLVIYVAGNVGHWHAADWLRMLIPPAAFVLWSALQPGALFDAVADWSTAERYGIGAIGAIALGAIAKVLAYRADQLEPEDTAGSTARDSASGRPSPPSPSTAT
jgi:hypothetical protein